MKNFSLSAILGLVFGISLVAYAVFAYTPPTQAPPGGNVSSPINTGTGDQTKTGGLLGVFGLWVNQSLGVTGGATFGGTVQVGSSGTSLTCNAQNKGTVYFNTNINKVTVCTGSAWEVFSTGADFDEDGFIAGTDCNDGNAAVWQYILGYPDLDSDTYTLSQTNVCSGGSLPAGYLTSGSGITDCNDSDSTKWQNIIGYVDSDGDAYGTGATLSVCSGSTIAAGYATAGNDCYDANASAYPGQTAWLTSHRGDGSFDYNCDAATAKEWPSAIPNCIDIQINTSAQGWDTAVPGCGQSGNWGSSYHPSGANCQYTWLETRTQACQ